MSSCCVPQSAFQSQIGGLPVKYGDKPLWYVLVAFYGTAAIYVLGILAAKLL